MAETAFRITTQLGENGPQEVVAFSARTEQFEKRAQEAINELRRVTGTRVVLLEIDDIRGTGKALDNLRTANPGMETGVAKGRVNSWTRSGDLPTPSRSRRSGYQRAL